MITINSMVDYNKLILEWDDNSDLSFINHLIALIGDRNSLLKEIEFLDGGNNE